MLITDLIIGRQNRWAELYDSQRLSPAGGKTFLIENGHVARHFLGGRLKRRDGPDALDRLEPGQGAIARIDRRRVAAYRDPDGVLQTLSATGTHLGCSVEWNTAERTWDCPCHGSRYAATGENIEGPAVEPLSRVSLPRP